MRTPSRGSATQSAAPSWSAIIVAKGGRTPWVYGEVFVEGGLAPMLSSETSRYRPTSSWLARVKPGGDCEGQTDSLEET